MDTSRTILIWIVSCLLKLEPFVAWEIPGFVILAFGTLLYNEIIVLPFLGFDKNTKVAQMKEQAEYMTTSPHAVYDVTRNQRALAKQDEPQVMVTTYPSDASN